MLSHSFASVSDCLVLIILNTYNPMRMELPVPSSKLLRRARFVFQLWKTLFVIRHLGIAFEQFEHPIRYTARFIFGNGPYTVLFRDHHTFTSHDMYKFYDLRSKPNSSFKLGNIVINHADRGECEEVFRGAYAWLPVKGKKVLDIGGNIGDSAIYFALNGAEKVYVFEVNPPVFNIARENIISNGLNDRIEIFNEGIGEGTAVINEENSGAGEFQIDPNDEAVGKSIRLMALDEVVECLALSNAALKIDCEGCEYFAILESSCETLSRFSHIIGEYHYGPDLLSKKLLDCGFKVHFSRPIYFFDPMKTNPHCLTGYFQAWR